MALPHFGQLGPFGQDLLARLGQLRTERISEAGVVIQKTLRQTQKELETYQDKLAELRIDLNELELADLDRKMQEQEKPEDTGSKPVATESKIAIAGSDSMVWPFEGEFWKDEIGGYRSFLREKCTEMGR